MVESQGQAAPIDRYVVLKYLAEGGMGAIYLGKKLGAGGFEKEVVLKQLLPEFTQQPEFIDLFLREARLSASLDHANIIHTIDLVTAGAEHFIVMEFLDGADLRTLLKRAKRRKGRLSAAAGVLIGREVLSALAYAHVKMGPHNKPLALIHRDVSPSNILVSKNGEVKLTDFGIAKASTHNSIFYRVKGKIGYMSPEQARSQSLDHRSDLYSLAVCIYEVITGERLFVHAGITTSADEIYSQPIELLSRKVPGLPAELDKVMLRALAEDPSHRYQTAGEFQEALLRAAHRTGLMMSAPELADHLREVCGPPDGWRELDRAETSANPGTEIYDEVEGTQQIDASEVEYDDYGSEDRSRDSFDDFDDELISVVVGPDELDAILSKGKGRRERAQTSITELGRIQDLELTSMINIAGLADDAGAEPLVDLDELHRGGVPASGTDSLVAELPADKSARAASRGGGDKSQGAAGHVLANFYDDDADGVASVLDHSSSSKDYYATPAPRASVGSSDRASSSIPSTDVTLEKRPRRWTWLIVALILLAGIGVAAAIGLTGPQLDAPVRGVDAPESGN